jgi:type II secretory pathway component PulJ
VARGFTIVELLVTTALTLLMMAAVVAMFSRIGTSVTDARSTLEMTDRLRAAALRLQMDLAGATVTMLPPRRPEANEGYFEYIEGPVGVAQKADGTVVQPWDVAVNTTDNPGAVQSPADTTVADFDDILMFTTRSGSRPFVGRWWDPVANKQSTIESDLAEVAWFVRGRTLYRRLLLVAPGVNLTNVATAGFWASNDISVRFDPNLNRLVPNTLGDLTRRECRFAHPSNAFPFDARRWGRLGLPTLRECSSPNWELARPLLPDINAYSKLLPQSGFLDLWSNDPTKQLPDTYLIAGFSSPDPKDPNVYGTRIAEDVILSHVIGFDVKAYDPGVPLVAGPNGVLLPGDANYLSVLNQPNSVVGYGAYVDLGYRLPNNYMPAGPPRPLLSGLGDPRSGLDATLAGSARVYDTWSLHYETVGAGPNWPPALRGVNGFDDSGSGVVDGPGDTVAPPPYPAPLRAVQVKIRVFEPDSRQVREVTIVQDFLPK